LAGAIRPKLRHALLITSQAWGGKTIDTLKGLLAGLKLDLLDPLTTKGLPAEADLATVDRLADTIIAKHAGL
jgi:flavorubredoxin